MPQKKLRNGRGALQYSTRLTKELLILLGDAGRMYKKVCRIDPVEASKLHEKVWSHGTEDH